MAATKLRNDELYRAILTFHGAAGQFVEAESEHRGDSPVVQLHPKFFALSSGGQAALDEASQAYQRSIPKPQRPGKKAWYREKPQEPLKQPCLKGFTHGGLAVEVGSIWRADHETVASAPSAFAPVRD